MMKAKHHTVCSNCDDNIEPGDPIHQTVSGWVHVTCPDDDLAVLAEVIPMHQVCGRCFCRHAGDC
jgi:hypothetical protein